MSFAFRLKQARERAGLTQAELAKKLDITKSAIGNYENGVSSPKEEILLRIFDALEIDPNFLFQDNFVPLTQPSSPGLSQEALSVAAAYDAATPSIRESVCKLLDVTRPLQKSSACG